mmetsp:Transcript_12506/g.45607  ORF Transcript_12506/g.45607 Transcript_12506/m.45607 type:complete len:143 (-) Transcript_12506:249-677(-)
MLETPVTSAPIVASFLAGLPAYRAGIPPLTRGVEVGLAHGFLLVGPFYKLGPLRDTDVALECGSLAAATLVIILTVCLTIYGIAQFQGETPETKRTLTGRVMAADSLQTADGWANFAAGFFVGAESGVLWAYLCLSGALLAF